LWLDTKIPFDKMEQAAVVYEQKLRQLGKEEQHISPEVQAA